MSAFLEPPRPLIQRSVPVYLSEEEWAWLDACAA